MTAWLLSGGIGVAGLVAGLVLALQLARARAQRDNAQSRLAAANLDREALAAELVAVQAAQAEARARCVSQIEELYRDNKVLASALAEAAELSAPAARAHLRGVFQRARAKTSGTGPHTAVQDAPGPAVPGSGDGRPRGR